MRPVESGRLAVPPGASQCFWDESYVAKSMVALGPGNLIQFQPDREVCRVGTCRVKLEGGASSSAESECQTGASQHPTRGTAGHTSHELDNTVLAR